MRQGAADVPGIPPIAQAPRRQGRHGDVLRRASGASADQARLLCREGHEDGRRVNIPWGGWPLHHLCQGIVRFGVGWVAQSSEDDEGSRPANEVLDDA
jgi:hypothetical protein